MAKRRAIVLYPAYFDADRSREDGRRVARRLAVNGPTVEEVARAADALGLRPRVEPERAHPSTPWKREGRVLVQADYYKTSVVRRVGERIREGRTGRES